MTKRYLVLIGIVFATLTAARGQTQAPCANPKDCLQIEQYIKTHNCVTEKCGPTREGKKPAPKMERSSAPPQQPQQQQQSPPPAGAAASNTLSVNISPDILKGLIDPLSTFAAAKKEDADTNAARLQQVEIPRQQAEDALTQAEAKRITALVPYEENMMDANAKLLRCQSSWKCGLLKDVVVQGMSSTGFAMGLAWQNVAGINVSQQGGGANVSNAGNNSATAQGGAGGAGGQGGSSSSSATGGSASATGGNSSSSSSSSSQSSSKSKSTSTSNSNASSSSSSSASTP